MIAPAPKASSRILPHETANGSPRPRKDSVVSDSDRDGDGERGVRQDERHDVRQHVPGHLVPVAGAERPGALEVRPGLDGQGLGPHQPRGAGPRRDADDDDDVEDARAEHGRQDDDERQERDDEEPVREPLEQRAEQCGSARTRCRPSVPRTIEMIVALMPTSSEIRAPHATSASTERRTVGAERVAGARATRASAASSGSPRASRPGRAAARGARRRRRTPRIARPTTPPGLRSRSRTARRSAARRRAQASARASWRRRGVRRVGALMSAPAGR